MCFDCKLENENKKKINGFLGENLLNGEEEKYLAFSQSSFKKDKRNNVQSEFNSFSWLRDQAKAILGEFPYYYGNAKDFEYKNNKN